MTAGYVWVLDADLKGYFDSIPHDKLLAQVARKVSDSRVLALIEAYLKQPILDGCREWTPTSGTPQGAVLSPLLANIYLDPLDHLLATSGFEMVRYAGRRGGPIMAGRRIEPWKGPIFIGAGIP